MIEHEKLKNKFGKSLFYENLSNSFNFMAYKILFKPEKQNN